MLHSAAAVAVVVEAEVVGDVAAIAAAQSGAVTVDSGPGSPNVSGHCVPPLLDER